MKRACVTVVLVGLLSAVAAWALEADEQLRFADGLYARGMWAVAVKEYQAFLAAHPDTPHAATIHYRMAECYRALGDRAMAERTYTRVYTDYPGTEHHFRAGLRRAELLEEAGQYEAEIKLLQALLAEAPPAEFAAAALYALGAAQGKAGREGEAVAAYQQVLERYAASPFASYAALALAGVHGRKPEGSRRAAELYEQAATRPATPRLGAEALFQLGELCFREKLFEKSARAYERLLKLYPNDERVPAARLPMAWAFHNAGLYADALQQCQEILTRGAPSAEEAEWLYLKANCQRQLLKNADAVETYAQLLAKYPQAEFADSAAYEKALALYRMARYEDAIREARGLTLTPRIKKDVYWLLAESYAAVHNEEGAIQYYRLLVDQFPDAELAADATYRLAHLLAKRGDQMQAADLFGHLARRYPDHELAPRALLASGVCLSKLQKHEDAVRDWTLLIQKYPSSPLVEEGLYQKAMSETYLHRDALALTSWRELLTKFPATRYAPDAHFWMGVLLEAGNRLEQAEAELRAVLTGGAAPELQLRARFRLALVLQRRGQVAEAAELFQGLVASPLKDKFSPELLEWLANHHLERQAYAAAAEAANLLVARADSDAWRQIGWYLSGRALLGLNRQDEARAAFTKAVAVPLRTRAAAESRLRLGDLALAAGDPTGARQEFEEAAKLAAADEFLAVRASAYAGLGRALKAQGDHEGAARHFLSVGILFDDATLVPECLYEAAVALQKVGKNEDSARVLQELGQRYPDSAWAKKAK